MGIKSTKPYLEAQVQKLLSNLYKAEKIGLIKEKVENNEYLLASYCGIGTEISEKWNVKIYTYSKKKGSHSVVCNDFHTLDNVLKGKALEKAPNLPVISIDDAGCGFPLCGVMVGATNGEQVITKVVPVEYFQTDKFKMKVYLVDYARKGIDLVKQLQASPSTHRIEICTGYVNSLLREKLRALGFHVSVVEIKGLLQDRLEYLFKEHIKQVLKQDIYYDPKDMEKEKIPMEYRKCVEFGIKNCPELLKSGWESLKGLNA